MGCSQSAEEGSGSLPEARNVDWAALRERLPISHTEEDKAKRIDLWKQFDRDSSDRVTYDEAYRGVEKILKIQEFIPGARWSTLFRRAYDRAARKGTMLQQGLNSSIEFLEFRLLLVYLYNYCEVQVLFEQFDQRADARITRQEFHNAVPLIRKLGVDVEDADALFNEIDTVRDGVLLFDEFAKWAAEAKLDADGNAKNLTVLTV